MLELAKSKSHVHAIVRTMLVSIQQKRAGNREGPIFKKENSGPVA